MADSGIKIVRIDRSNRSLFSDMIFESEQAFFGEPELVGVLDGEKPVGTAVFTVSSYRMRIHAIYVMPEYRNRGIGTAVMRHILQIGKKRGAMFVVAHFFHAMEKMVNFFLNCGFVITREPGVYYFYLMEAAESETVKKYFYGKKYHGICKSVAELNETEKRQMQDYLEENMYSPILLKRPGFQPYLSFCVFDDSGKLLCVMMTVGFGDKIIIDFMLGTGESNSAMLLMFKRLMEALLDCKGHETMMIIFQAENASAVALAEKLLEKHMKEADFVCYAVREIF